MVRWRLILTLLLCCGACVDNDPLSPERVAAERSWFLPNIASELDAAGRLPGTRPKHQRESEISAQQAVELADRFFVAFGPLSEDVWAIDARRPIRALDLTRCRRVDFIEHPYEAMPTDASEYFRAHNGSQWLVRYCEPSDRLAVEVYVSAQGLSVSIDSAGEFRSNVPLTNFWTNGVPLDQDGVKSSESAARAVFSRAPDPIAEIPRMIRLSRNWVPSVISWVVTQSTSAGMRTSTMALPKGSPTQWVLRPAESASVELDSLMDVGVTPAMLRVLRRRREAVTSTEFPQ